MKFLRDIVSLALITSIAMVPVLSVGCADQGATSSAKPPEGTMKVGEGKAKSAADGKAKPKPKTPSSTSESGSTTGSGVKPPVK